MLIFIYPPREGTAMQKITPFLWFDTQAEEAANFYYNADETQAVQEEKP
jgi:predicted 3-demethylubiquinone-9 3-methyltransferase (glyoxalase superfamily)